MVGEQIGQGPLTMTRVWQGTHGGVGEAARSQQRTLEGGWQLERITVDRSDSFLGSLRICRWGWSCNIPKEKGDTLGEGRDLYQVERCPATKDRSTWNHKL